jgi:hypothetical protein
MFMKVAGLVTGLAVFVSAETLQPQESKIFNDPPLALKQYGYGALGGVVAGALGFYIGSGLESAIRGSEAKNGTLEFTGIRYDNFHGSFYGGGTGLWLGSALTAYFVGSVDEEDGGVWATLAGGALTTAAAMGLATTLGVHDRIDWPAMLPLVAVPASGAMLSFNVSRYFRDKERARATGETVGWQPPRVQWGYAGEASGFRLDALRWTFQ